METVLLDLVDPPRWWLRLGLEKANPVKGCSEEDCDPSSLTSVDVFCETHGRFLPTAGVLPKGLVAAAVNVGRASVCAAFVLAAQAKTSFPLFLVGVLVAVAVLLPPLRLYPIAIRSAFACWMLAAWLTFFSSTTALPFQRRLVIGALVLLSVAATVHLGPVAARSSRDTLLLPHNEMSVTARVRGYVAASAAVLPTAALSWIALALIEAAWGTSTALLREFLLVTVVGAVAAVVLTAVVYGILYSGNRVEFSLHKPLGWPRRPGSLTWSLDRWRPNETRVRGLADYIGREVTLLLFQVAQISILVLRSAVQFARLLVYAAVYLLVSGFNAVISVIMWIAQWMASVFVGAIKSVVSAAQVLGNAVPHTFRVIVLPVVSVAYAAVLTVFWSRRTFAYLVDGTAWALVGSLLSAVGAVMLLVTAWIALSGMPVGTAVRSANRTLAISGANALVLLAVGGWAVGLAGTLGLGEVRVGPVTITASVILATAWVYSRLRRHAPVR
jgi:hypothetical protein